MSLLMQALKKAERARQSGLQEEDVPERADEAPDQRPGLAADNGPAATPAVQGDQPVAAPPPVSGLELSLEPLEPPGGAAAGSPTAPPLPPVTPPAPAPIEPAREAVHDPVPPQARHEQPRTRPDPDSIPVTDARPAPRPPSAGPADSGRGTGSPDRRATPRVAPGMRPRQDATAGIDVARLRVYGLGGLLFIIVLAFIWWYRQAVTGPGPGAGLPMVPMPPPSATGATNVPGGSGAPIVVTPGGASVNPAGGPSFGPLPGQALPASTQPMLTDDGTLPVEPPASLTPRPATPRRAAPREPAWRAPTAAQLAAIEDPEIRREAMRDAAERELREQTRVAQGGVETGALAPSPSPAPSVEPAVPPAVVARAAREAASTRNETRSEARGDLRVSRGTPRQAIDPAVQAGYAALQAGDGANARRQYEAALRTDPNNRDALLGLATLARREQRAGDAADAYARLLRRDPRDADALAGMVALRPGDGDAAELRLKGALRNRSGDGADAAALHFALGNQYARRGRWQEAQQAYFHAWSATPTNADYAFNLAIGLDRMNQGRLARDYYQRALTLSASAPAAFDRAIAERRLAELAAAAVAVTPPPVTPAPVPGLPAVGN